MMPRKKPRRRSGGHRRASASSRTSPLRNATALERCLGLLREGGNNDPKLEALIGYLRGTHPGVSRRWLDLGCILFSQYYDTVRWVGDETGQAARVRGLGHRPLRRQQPLRHLAQWQVPALRPQ